MDFDRRLGQVMNPGRFEVGPFGVPLTLDGAYLLVRHRASGASRFRRARLACTACFDLCRQAGIIVGVLVVHWTTAAEDELHGLDAVIRCLSGDPPPAPPSYHEVRDGLVWRWIDCPG
jgi:hypothetical protein